MILLEQTFNVRTAISAQSDYGEDAKRSPQWCQIYRLLTVYCIKQLSFKTARTAARLSAIQTRVLFTHKILIILF